jgi:hypothetical protein
MKKRKVMVSVRKVITCSPTCKGVQYAETIMSTSCYSLIKQGDIYPLHSEAFITTNINKVFSGYQPCQLVEITDVSGTISVPIIRYICGAVWTQITALMMG